MSFLGQYQKITTKSYLVQNLNYSWKSFVKEFYLNPSFLIRKLALLFIGCYRTIGTTFLGGCCRFEPSCSEYALVCFHNLSLAKALKLTFFRVLKCRPFGPVGYDPVPLINTRESLKHATK